jgi:hypothetical protein
MDAVDYRLDARNGGLSTNSRFKTSAPICRSSQACRDASATERRRRTFGSAGLPAV